MEIVAADLKDIQIISLLHLVGIWVKAYQQPSTADRLKTPWRPASFKKLKLIQLGRNRVHNSPPLVSTLIQINPIHVFPFYSFKMHLNIILSSTPMSCKWPLSLSFPHQHPVLISVLHHTFHITLPSHHPMI
jgi:hypothetical protein